MKKVKREFLKQLICFWALQAFCLSVVVPCVAWPNTHLRTRSAREGGVETTLSQALKVASERAKDGAEKVTDPLLSRYQEDEFFGTDEIPRSVPITHADFFELMVLEGVRMYEEKFGSFHRVLGEEGSLALIGFGLHPGEILALLKLFPQIQTLHAIDIFPAFEELAKRLFESDFILESYGVERSALSKINIHIVPSGDLRGLLPDQSIDAVFSRYGIDPGLFLEDTPNGLHVKERYQDVADVQEVLRRLRHSVLALRSALKEGGTAFIHADLWTPVESTFLVEGFQGEPRQRLQKVDEMVGEDHLSKDANLRYGPMMFVKPSRSEVAQDGGKRKKAIEPLSQAQLRRMASLPLEVVNLFGEYGELLFFIFMGPEIFDTMPHLPMEYQRMVSDVRGSFGLLGEARKAEDHQKLREKYGQQIGDTLFVLLDDIERLGEERGMDPKNLEMDRKERAYRILVGLRNFLDQEARLIHGDDFSVQDGGGKKTSEISDREKRIREFLTDVLRAEEDVARKRGRSPLWDVAIATEPDVTLEILNHLHLRGNETLLDLGSGTGAFTLLASTRVRKSVGIEKDRERHEQGVAYQAQLSREKLIDPEKVVLRQGNFMEEDFSEYDVIYWYRGELKEPEEHALVEKVIRELRPGAQFVVYAAYDPKFDFGDWNGFRMTENPSLGVAVYQKEAVHIDPQEGNVQDGGFRRMELPTRWMLMPTFSL